MTDPRAAGVVLDADVRSALDALSVEAVGAVRITGLPSARSNRTTVRVALADGRTVKVRRLSRPSKAERFGRLVEALGHARLPAVLRLDGRIAVEAWVEGTPLSKLPATPERLRQAADILGSLHGTRRIGRRSLHATVSTRRLVQRVKRHLAKLAATVTITRHDALALSDALSRFAPREALLGLTHNDFCAANLVEDADGRLFVVDNEGLRLGFLDYDLARTWYRWPLPGPDWTMLLDRYATWRDPAPGLAHAPFWRIAAVVKSAHLRMTRGVPTAIPVDRLRELVGDLGATG